MRGGRKDESNKIYLSVPTTIFYNIITGGNIFVY
jgi:hypothetical protein